MFNSNANVFAGLTPPRFNLFAAIQALKNEGVAKILASPTLVTLNGKPADFIVGGEQPIPQVVATAAAANSGLVYKPFGIRLTFVPVLVGGGRIRIDVVPELSRPVPTGDIFQGVRVVAFETQRLRATVEMESGQTLALGGLLRQEEDAQVSKVPVLGDLPWVGALFRRTAASKVETELLILVTPRLAEPLRGEQVPSALPGLETRPPTDAELFLKGMIEAPAGPEMPTMPSPSPLPGDLAPLPEPFAPPKDDKDKGTLGKPREAGPDTTRALPPLGAMTTRGVAGDEAAEWSGYWTVYSLESALRPAAEEPVAGTPDWLGAGPPG